MARHDCSNNNCPNTWHKTPKCPLEKGKGSKGKAKAPSNASKSPFGQNVEQGVKSEDIEYYNSEGKLHRLDGPAVIFNGGVENGGDEEWYKDGEFHRLDGPAKIWKGGVENGGHEGWYINGKRHRLDGPAQIADGGVEDGGSEYWWKEGNQHRLDGPAVIENGGVKNGAREEWWKEGKKHRLDGPAVIRLGGVENGGSEEWWENGKLIKEVLKPPMKNGGSNKWADKIKKDFPDMFLDNQDADQEVVDKIVENPELLHALISNVRPGREIVFGEDSEGYESEYEFTGPGQIYVNHAGISDDGLSAWMEVRFYASYMNDEGDETEEEMKLRIEAEI